MGTPKQKRVDFEQASQIDWFNISECLQFMKNYPEIGWHGKAREQLSPNWVRAFEDLTWIKNNITEIYDICLKAKQNSKFYGRGRNNKEQN